MPIIGLYRLSMGQGLNYTFLKMETKKLSKSDKAILLEVAARGNIKPTEIGKLSAVLGVPIMEFRLIADRAQLAQIEKEVPPLKDIEQ